MVGVRYKKLAFPWILRMLDQRGNPDTIDRLTLMLDFLN